MDESANNLSLVYQREVGLGEFCSNALKYFNYASKNCYYAHIMLAHEQVA